METTARSIVPHRRAGDTLIAAVAVAILAVATYGSKAEPQAADVASYQARVVEIYGDKAIVEIDGQRHLVEPIAPGRAFPSDAGSEIRIVGHRRGNILIPSRIVLPSGSVVQSPPDPGLASMPAPSEKDRTIAGQLATHGIEVTGRPYRRRNHTVVAGRGKDGRSVIASFDHNLRLVEIEEAEHRHIHPSSPEALPEAEVAKLLAKRGYSTILLLDQSRFRFLYSASGPQGERMELHLDRGGNILKRVWLR
jgi:hypothetical protein